VPEEPDNTEQQEEKQDPFKGTKFEGKTPQEIAEMYGNLETRLGTQGEELGYLRQVAQQRPAQQEREPARKSDYVSYAEDLIVEPERVLPAFGEEIERRAVEKATRLVTQQMSAQQQIENFFRAHPELEPHRDIVSVIGEKIYAQYPNAPLGQVLGETERQAKQYIANLAERFDKKRGTTDRMRAAVTTGGGKTREAAQEDEPEDRGAVMSSEQQNVMDEIKRIKDSRAKKMLPPRHR